jgi:MFS family permease
MREEGSKERWLWAFVPINTSANLFLTFLPLYILELGGNVIDVGTTTSAYFFSLIPGAIFWGYIIDRFPHRKSYIVFSYFGMGAILVAIYFFNSLPFLSLFLFLYGLIWSPSVPCAYFILMKKFSKDLWPNIIAKLSYIASIGTIIGLIIGFSWTMFFDLKILIIIGAVFSFLSSALIQVMVNEGPEIANETVLSGTKNNNKASSDSNVSRAKSIHQFARMLRLMFFGNAVFLYFSAFIFNLGTNIFVTSYIPSLKDAYVSDSTIFLMTLISVSAQTLVNFYVHKSSFFEQHKMFDRMLRILALRAGSFLAAVGIAIFFQGNVFTVSSIILYSAIGVSLALYNTAISSLVLGTLSPRRQGMILGIYSALAGIFSFVGTFVSGYFSYSLNYFATFSFASFLMVVSLFLLSVSARKYRFRSLQVID